MLMYILGRLGLMILLSFFAVFCGEVILSAVTVIVPSDSLKEFLIEMKTKSLFGFAVMLCFLIAVFIKDGIKSAAYKEDGILNVSIVAVIMFAVNFLPVLFKEDLALKGKGGLFYKAFYYPALWLGNFENERFMNSVMLESVIICVVCLAGFVISRKIYIKKHPVLSV